MHLWLEDPPIKLGFAQVVNHKRIESKTLPRVLASLWDIWGRSINVWIYFSTRARGLLDLRCKRFQACRQFSPHTPKWSITRFALPFSLFWSIRVCSTYPISKPSYTELNNLWNGSYWLMFLLNVGVSGIDGLGRRRYPGLHQGKSSK